MGKTSLKLIEITFGDGSDVPTSVQVVDVEPVQGVSQLLPTGMPASVQSRITQTLRASALTILGVLATGLLLVLAPVAAFSSPTTGLASSLGLVDDHDHHGELGPQDTALVMDNGPGTVLAPSVQALAYTGSTFWPLDNLSVINAGRKGNGHDFPAPAGSPVYAVRDGLVEKSADLVGYESRLSAGQQNGYYSYGRYIRINHPDSPGSMVYAHLSQRLVSAGERVRGGQLIGYTGNTGYSFGPHLHVDWNGQYNAVAWLNTAATVVPGAQLSNAATLIDEKWLSLGGAQGVLGPAKSGDVAGPTPQAMHRMFANGVIFSQSGQSAYAVYGLIGARYLNLGHANSPLGYPTSDEVAGANGSRLNTFQNGTIVWSPATGAREVYGAIGARYGALGGPASPLGLPTSGEVAGANGSRLNTFQNGTIVWSPATGARETYNAR